MIKTGSLLYERMIDITADYLGPAAHRFIDRQIQNHLEIEPQDIRPADLPKLIEWIRAAISILTDDAGLVDEYSARLEELVTNAGQTT